MKKFWKKQIPSFLMALVLLASLVPAASARSRADITYQVDAGDEVAFSRRDFSDLYDEDPDTRGSMTYLVFTDYSELDDYGHFTSIDDEGDRVTLRERDLRSKWFYYANSNIPTSGDCYLDDLAFVADRDASGTLTLEFDLVNTDGNRGSDKCSGTLEIEIGKGGSSHHSGKADISYSVDADDEVAFSRRDFSDLYDKDPNTRGSMTYLVFTDYSDLDDYGHLTSIDDGGDRVTLRERDLRGKWFYYANSSIPTSGDCYLDDLAFVADRRASGTLTLGFDLVNTDGNRGSNTCSGVLKIEIGKGGGSSHHSGKADISYSVDADDEVAFSRRDFSDLYDKAPNTRGSMTYLVFTDYSDLDDYGHLTSIDDGGDRVTLREKDLRGKWFYYANSSIPTSGDCYLDDLAFVADRRASGTLTLGFDLVNTDGNRGSDKCSGTLEIKIGKGGSSSSSKKGDINYTAKSNEETEFRARDFERYYDDNCSGTFRYVEFTNSDGLSNYTGTIYSRYGYRDEKAFTASALERSSFYFDNENYGDYDLDELSFVAKSNFTDTVKLSFRAHGSGSNYVDGTVVIAPEGGSSDGTNIVDPVSYGTGADIRYYNAGLNLVQINANDIARYYAKQIPGGQLQSVRLAGVPTEGNVIYNYTSSSPYGGGYQIFLTSTNCREYTFAYNPTSYSDYALSELSFVPSRTNSAVAIPFVANGTGGAVAGTIYISSTTKKVPEVYGPTPKNTAVPFPSKQVYNAVNGATGKTMAGIRFLALPPASAGKLTMTSGGTSLNITLQSTFGYSSGAWQMSQIRFVPNNGFTGSVELPYAAYDSTGTVFAAGTVSLGVVNQLKKFKDVNSSTWCYKYVVELSDAKVIDGYKDGTFKEKNALTWGAALKLVMRAAGYPEQAPTVKNSPFSGYLAKAKADGLVSGNINLSKPITRGQVSQLAAKALKLNTSNLPQNKPFTDTSDVYIQALNAAGIIGGYSDGTFKPNNTLTRGHISAIVWRMIQYRK